MAISPYPLLFSMSPPTPRSTLFPYTTLFRSQIMEGDVIRTIQQHHQHIAHYHTGGVPGRNELDDTQELQWPAICRAIVDTGFTGYLAHEFVPKRDPLTSLREAVVLCDV